MTPEFQISFSKGNWTNVPPPRNWKPGLILELVFTDSEPSSTLEGGGFEWVNTKDDQTATNINNYITGGVNGQTPGIFEGLPLQIFIPGTPNVYLFQGVIDLPKGTYECDKVVCPIKYVNAIDWFHTLASSITYLSLTQAGLAEASIPPPSGFNAYIGPPNSGAKYSYKIIPYLVTQQTDLSQAIILFLECVSMINQIDSAITKTGKSVTDLIAFFATDPPLDIASAIIDCLALIANIIFDILLWIALVGLVETLINMCGLIMKFKYAMTANDIINASFDFINNYLGTPSGNPISFSSSILSGTYQNVTIMPRKIYKENSSDMVPSLFNVFKSGGILTRGSEVIGGNMPPYSANGSPIYGAYGYPDWNFKEVFDNLGKVFNAKLFFIGGQVRFEEVHYFVNGNFTLPNIGSPSNDTLNLPAPYSYNCNELPWNYLISFLTDDDERTMIVYTGTTCNVCTQPNGTWNVQNLLPETGMNLALPFALAKRKEYLNFIEIMVNDIFNGVNSLYSVLKIAVEVWLVVTSPLLAIIVFADPNLLKRLLPQITFPSLNPLIGVLEVSKDTWQTPKIFIGIPNNGLWYIEPNQGQNNNGVWNNPNVPSNTPGRGEGNVSSWALMNQFHSKNLPLFIPVDSTGNKLPQINNQWILYKTKKFKMCASDYAKILGNNMFTVPQPGGGSAIAKFDKLKYNVYDEMATDVEYRVSKIYDNNFTTITTIDGN